MKFPDATSLLTAFLLFGCFSAQQSPAAEGDLALDFQGFRWSGHNVRTLEITNHREQSSLRFQSIGPNSIALIEKVEFREGVIEMDLASTGRSYPTIALFVSPDIAAYDQLTLNPWPCMPDEPWRRLRQAIVTMGESLSIIVNFHMNQALSEESDQWFHVRLVIDKDLCRVFIDDDLEPAFVVNNQMGTKRGSGLGLCKSSCFVRNVVVTPGLVQPNADQTVLGVFRAERVVGTAVVAEPKGSY